MADEFRRQFYGKNFNGCASTLYVGDRFWNVKMDGLSDSCVFTHGWSELVNDLVLDRRSTFVFSMTGYKTFEVSVFNHQTGTEIQFKKKMSTAETDVEQGVVGDCEDDIIQLSTFESIFNDIDDSKFDKFFSSLVEMEDVKKKVDPKGKSNVFACDRSLSSKVVSDVKRMPFVGDTLKSSPKVDVDKFVVPKKKKEGNL
ncbi:putative transcription factor B3-Domain family [Helianthus debilis subsp. tardiflorus]